MYHYAAVLLVGTCLNTVVARTSDSLHTNLRITFIVASQSPATAVQREFVPAESAQTAGQSFEYGSNRDERAYEQASHTISVVHLTASGGRHATFTSIKA